MPDPMTPPRSGAHASSDRLSFAPVRVLLRVLVLACVLGSSVAAGAGAAQAAEAPIVAVDSIGITVSDMERAVDFYANVLGFERESEREVTGDRYEHLYGQFGTRLRIVRLRLGEERIELMQFLAPRGRPIPADSRSNDRWFQHVAIIVSDMGRAYALLRERGVAHASSGPQRLPDWNPNAGGIEAFYFRDPDGNHLEILAFPPGKGAPRWQRKDRLFLGIDHTAIVVADTDASLAFYRDRLGFTIAGTSENHGPEQERLNNVFGARLRITALKVADGPGVELLEYLAPRNGRPMPLDTAPSDLWYWQINLLTRDARALEATLRGSHDEIVSGARIELPARELGYGAALTIRDPDRHASLVLEAGSSARAARRPATSP